MADVSPEVIAPARFLNELWGTVPPDWIAEFNLLQYRPTQEDTGAKRMRAMFYRVGSVLQDWDTIARHLDRCNRTQVENIHHGVNPRFRQPRRGHGTNADVSHYVALWVDVDFGVNETEVRKQFCDTVEDLRKLGLGPSCIVESGRGLHAYWLLDKLYTVQEARPACAGIQDYFKISDAVHDPRRILRVPGFLNLKDPKDPKWCAVTEATWQRFPLSAFKEFRVEPSKSEHDRELEDAEKNKPNTLSRDPKIEAIKGGVDKSGGPYGGRHLAAVALAGHYCSRRKLTKKSILYAMLDWNRQNKPPLSDDEVTRIVDDIWTKEQIKRAEEPEPEEKEKKEPSRGPEDGPPWFDEDGKFNPAILAGHLMGETKYLSTPVGRDGKGIMLYRYVGGVFRPDGYDFVRREIARILGRDSRKSRIEETVELVNEFAKKPYDEIDRQAHELVNVKNGMLRWKTGELVPHDPKYLSLIQVPVEWVPDAKSEKLDEFFRMVLPEDALGVAEEFTGLILVPDTSFAKCLVLVGEGGNGKSTFLKLVEALIGKENITYYSLHSIVEDRFTAAGLLGKLANFHDELEQRALENTGAFKQIVAGDPIKAEEKNKAPFSFRPFCRLIFATNQMPRATDRSQAYFDRLLFVEFQNRIRNATGEILDYGRVLSETPGVLQAFLVRAVVGLKRLMERSRFSIPSSSIDAIEDYRRDCNSAYDFLRESCRTDDPNGWLAKNILYDRYRAWSEDEGRKPMSAREFAKTVQQTPNVRGIRHGTARGWGGLAWMNGEPPRTSADEVAEFGKPKAEPGKRQRELEF